MVDVSQLAPAEARAALASKADEIQRERRAEKRGLKMLEVGTLSWYFCTAAALPQC